MAKQIAAHINAFVYGRGRRKKNSGKAEEEKKRDKQSLAALPLHPFLSVFLFLPQSISAKKKRKKNLSFHHQIQADLYASGAKQTNIIFSVSRL